MNQGVGAFDGQGISLRMLYFGPRKMNKGWYPGPDGKDVIDIRNAVSE